MITYYTPKPAEIRNTRLRADMNQDRCADIVCVTQVTWSRWEMGTHHMPPGLWKLFLIESRYKGAVNEVNEVNTTVTPLTKLTDSWDEDPPQ